MKRFTLYSKTTIFIFSILLTGFGGAILLAHNIRKTGKSKGTIAVCFLSIVLISILRQMVIVTNLGALLEFLIPQIVCGGLLVTVCWDRYLFDVEGQYNNKHILIPLIVTIVLYGSTFGLIYYNSHR